MTQREDFEAWWKTLDSNYPCYGEENHKAIAMNAWFSAQAAQAQAAAPGDIRALKHRIHELEGEVIGYKRILDEQDKAEPVAWIISSPHWTSPMVQVNKPTRLMQDETLAPLYTSPPDHTKASDKQTRKDEK